VDRSLSLTNTKLESMRVVINGREIQVSQLAAEGRNGSTNTLEVLYECYRNGATIVLNSLQQRWEPLQRYCRALGRDISARIQANVYVTPSGAQGFSPHYDTHDVFVAQVHGTKHWRLARPRYELPLRDQIYDKSQPEPRPEREFDLFCGDLLYMPRGTIHWAASQESTSVHVTIGVHPVVYAEALSDAMQKLYAEDVRFRRTLPPGFAVGQAGQRAAHEAVSELLHVLRSRLSASDIVAESVRQATSISAPALRHHLTDLERLGQVARDTLVRRRDDQRWHMTAGDGTIGLYFHNKTVKLPADVADAVRYVAQTNGEGFTADAIPGDLDEPGRLVLIRTLLREGFLTFV